jgi:hypothetical protein
MKKSRARRWTGSVLGTIVETPLARRLNTTSDVMVPNEASRETLNRIRHEGNETLLPAWVSPAVRLIEHAGRNHTSGSEINRRMSVIMYDIATEQIISGFLYQNHSQYRDLVENRRYIRLAPQRANVQHPPSPRSHLLRWSRTGHSIASVWHRP